MSFASMPLFTGDYLRDTRHLTPLRHGIYLLALMHCWDSKGPMPLDEQEAAGICNCRSADEIDALRYVMDRFFVRMDDGHYNKRMAEEVARFERLSKTFSEAGLRSAEVRREKARIGTRAKSDSKITAIEGRLNLGSTEAEGRSVSPSPTLSLSQTPNTPPTPQGGEGRFERFWSAYPKKIGKDAARKAFEKRKPSETLLKAMLSAIAMQASSSQWRKDGGQFIPNPATWLNQGRWQDINIVEDDLERGAI